LLEVEPVFPPGAPSAAGHEKPPGEQRDQRHPGDDDSDHVVDPLVRAGKRVDLVPLCFGTVR
jgi:hypothetical protein